MLGFRSPTAAGLPGRSSLSLLCRTGFGTLSVGVSLACQRVEQEGTANGCGVAEQGSYQQSPGQSAEWSSKERTRIDQHLKRLFGLPTSMAILIG